MSKRSIVRWAPAAALSLILLAAPSSRCRAAALHYADGTTKALTDDDLRWLAVVIYGETAGEASAQDAEAMVWTLAQRSYWSPTWNKYSLAALAQAYSTTTNPAYLADGAKCKPKIDQAATAKKELPSGDNCAAHRFPLRQCYQSLSWDDIKNGGKACQRWDARKQALVDFKTAAAPSITTALEQFKAGTLANPVPGAIGWLDPVEWKKVTAAQHAAKVAQIGDNVYYASDMAGKDERGHPWSTSGWTGAEVTVK